MRWQAKKQKPAPVSELNGTCSRTARYPTRNRPNEPAPKRYPTPNREQGSELSHGSDSDTHVVYQGDSGARERTAVFGDANHLQALHAELEDDGYDLSRLSADLVIGAEKMVAEHGARAAADWLKAVLAEEAPRGSARLTR